MSFVVFQRLYFFDTQQVNIHIGAMASFRLGVGHSALSL